MSNHDTDRYKNIKKVCNIHLLLQEDDIIGKNCDGKRYTSNQYKCFALHQFSVLMSFRPKYENDVAVTE